MLEKEKALELSLIHIFSLVLQRDFLGDGGNHLPEEVKYKGECKLLSLIHIWLTRELKRLSVTSLVAGLMNWCLKKMCIRDSL